MHFLLLLFQQNWYREVDEAKRNTTLNVISARSKLHSRRNVEYSYAMRCLYTDPCRECNFVHSLVLSDYNTLMFTGTDMMYCILPIQGITSSMDHWCLHLFLKRQKHISHFICALHSYHSQFLIFCTWYLIIICSTTIRNSQWTKSR